MLAYGGNGPVFAAIHAQELGIDRVLVPRAGGWRRPRTSFAPAGRIPHHLPKAGKCAR
jgi:hypothetical protein